MTALSLRVHNYHRLGYVNFVGTLVTPSYQPAGMPCKSKLKKRCAFTGHHSFNATTTNTSAATAQSWDIDSVGLRNQHTLTTNFLGWRHLHVDEVVRLCKEDLVIVLLPSIQR